MFIFACPVCRRWLCSHTLFTMTNGSVLWKKPPSIFCAKRRATGRSAPSSGERWCTSDPTSKLRLVYPQRLRQRCDVYGSDQCSVAAHFGVTRLVYWEIYKQLIGVVLLAMSLARCGRPVQMDPENNISLLRPLGLPPTQPLDRSDCSLSSFCCYK